MFSAKLTAIRAKERVVEEEIKAKYLAEQEEAKNRGKNTYLINQTVQQAAGTNIHFEYIFFITVSAV